MVQEDCDPSTERSRFSRRRFVALAGAGLTGGLAGCGGDADGGAPTPTADQTSTPAPSPTRTPTATETPTPSGPSFGSVLSSSPSTHVAPTDGFATADWLDERTLNVVRVTNLDAEGEGSLRWAMNHAGSRVVVFEVGGMIDLGGENIAVSRPNVWVAGQTAPSPGITLVRGGVEIESDDVLLQHLRVRPGDDVPTATDAVSTVTASNVIVDHCSVSWGTDENLSVNSGPVNEPVTFANNLVAEGLRDSIHRKGPHSMGTLIMDRSERVTIAGNLWAHNVGRHPRLKGGTSSVVVNNVAYDFDRGTNLGGGVDDPTTASIVGNHYRAGEITDPDDPVVGTTFTDETGPVRVYAEGNETGPSMPLFAEDTAIERAAERPLWPDSLDAVGAGAAYDAALRAAGARPADRTPHDERIVADVRDRTGRPIDGQAEVGGYPDLEPTERALDVPDSGLAEWLREFTVAVESV